MDRQDAGLGLSAGPSPATRDAVRRAVAADLEPVRAPSSIARGLAAAGVGATLCALAAMGFGMRGPIDGGAVAKGLAASLAATLAISLALLPRRRWRPLARDKMRVMGAIALAMTAAIAVLGEGLDAAEAHSTLTLACAASSAATGALTTVAVLWLLRLTDPWGPGLSGALVGAASAGGAAFAAWAACGADGRTHLLVGHALSVIVVAAGGALLGRRWLSP